MVFFHSGGRILAIEEEPENIREIVGTILLVSFIIGICLSIFSAIISKPIDGFFKTNLSRDMILLAPFVFVLSIHAALLLILQGINRIYLLSILNVIPVLFYLLSIFILSNLQLISIVTVLFSTQISYLVVIIFIIVWLQPSFKSTMRWWPVIRENNKTYGGPVYKGSLANVATSYINRLAIAYWVDNTSIGFYSLASSLTEPLKLIPNAVATSSFRSFAKQRKISPKIIFVTIGFSMVTLSIALLFFGQPLSWVYTKNFAPVGALARALSAAAILIGFGDFFNRFLGAHGKGKELRDAAYLMGGVNVVGFLLLVPRWGVWGLVLTSIFAGIAYFLFIFGHYRKQITTIDSELEPIAQRDGCFGAEDDGLDVQKNIPDVSQNSGEEEISGSKVIILLDSFGYPNGMASTRRVQLIARALAQNDFQVKILCVRALEKKPFVINKNTQGVFEGIPFEYSPGTTIRSDRFLARRFFDIKGVIVALARLIAYRLNNQVDCIYYYGNIMENSLNRWIFYSIAKILGVPIVTDISEPPWVLNQHANWFSRLLSPLVGVNGVVLISKFLKDWVIGESSKVQRTIPVLHLPVLVDTNDYKTMERKMDKLKKAVLFSGSDQKIIKFIIQTMEQVWKIYPDCELILTGYEPGSFIDPWSEDVIQHGFAKGKVNSAGYLPRSELLNLYQSVSALLIPLFGDIRSQARFPTKIAEYLSSGTPIVTCRVGEVEQYLKDGVTAFVCDPDSLDKYADKIIESIDPLNWKKASEVGRNGRDMADANFDICLYKKPIATFFSSVCTQTGLVR